MFTTDGINFSAKSAKETGAFCEFEEKVKLKNINVNKTNFEIFFFI